MYVCMYVCMYVVYRGVESLCMLLTTNKMPFDLATKKCKSKYCHHLKTGFI